MKKQIISNDENKINVVILSNDALGVVAKGIAKCHEGDTYNKELGLNLANTRAWLKYYEKLGKNTKKELEWAEEIRKFWENEIVRLTKQEHMAATKLEEIKAEYEKTMESI